MGMFGRKGMAASALPYEEMMRRQALAQMQQSGPGTAGLGEGIPGGVPAHLASSSPAAAQFLPMANPMEGIRDALANNAMQAGAQGGPVAAHAYEHSPDYAGHYGMHGRDERGMFGAKPKRNTGQKILGFLGDFATNYSASQGNPMAIQTLRDRAAAKKAAQQQEVEFQGHDRIVRLLMGRGMSAEDAELAALDPKSIGTELNTRFRTREASQGETIYTPGIGNQPASTYTAPLIVENGPQRVRLDANTGTSQVVFQGRTPAQWAAEEAGIAAGTPSYNRFMQDFHLDGQGPTAVQMNAARLGQSDVNNQRSVGASVGNNIRSTGASRENSIRSTGVSRENNVRSTGASRANAVLGAETTRGGAGYQGRGGRGGARAGTGDGAIITNPQTGQRMQLRGGQWVPMN